MISLTECYAPSKPAGIDPKQPAFEFLAERLGIPAVEPLREAVVQLERRRLLGDVKSACKIASKHSTKPALSNILVSIDSESLGMRAYNGECTIQFGDDAGLSALVDPFDVAKILGKSKSADVSVTVRQPETDWRALMEGCTATAGCVHDSDSDSWQFSKDVAREFLDNRRPAPEITIRAGSAEFTLPGIGEHESADVETFEPIATATVSADDFRRLLAETVYCAEVESTRYALGAVMMEIGDSELTAVSTDARRLAVLECPAATADYRAQMLERWQSLPDDDKTPKPAFDETGNANGLIPVSYAKLALGMLPKASPEAVTVRIGENHWSITFDHRWQLSGRQLEGRFPKWRDLMPSNSDFGHVVTFNRKRLIESLETATVICEERPVADFVFDANGEHIEIRTKSATGKTANVAVPLATAVDVKRVSSVSYDPTFIAEYAKTAVADSVSLAMIDSESAGMLFADGSARYIVMPCARQ